MFGNFIRDIRIKNEIGLRQFCVQHDYDPSNWSKIERGALPPPSDVDTLEKWAKQLGIKKNSKDWHTFFDLASVTRGELPEYIKSRPKVLLELPVFFRTLSSQKPTKVQLKKLAKLLRENTKSSNGPKKV